MWTGCRWCTATTETLATNRIRNRIKNRISIVKSNKSNSAAVVAAQVTTTFASVFRISGKKSDPARAREIDREREREQ